MNQTFEASIRPSRPFATAPATVSEPGYEFNDLEEAILRKTHQRLSAAAVFLLALSAAQIVAGFALNAPGSISVLGIGSSCMIAVMMKRASRSFEKTVCTEGEDITHLMTALDSLNRVFGWMAGSYLLATVALLVTVTLVAGAR